MRRTPLLPATTGLLLTLASCAVYVPTAPLAPMVRASGQADVSAGFNLPGRLEASAVYSPAPHVLLTGMAAGMTRFSTETNSAQYEAGVGLYQNLGEHWVLSGVGGFGQAHSRQATTVLGYTLLMYEANYRKTFGQVAITHTSGEVKYGLTYRLTNVTFNNLREVSSGPIALRSMLRHEVAGTIRVPLAPGSRWEGNATLGMSLTDDYNQSLANKNGFSDIDIQKNSITLFGVGLTYLLGKR